MDDWLGVRNSRQDNPIEVHITAAKRNAEGLRAWNLCSMAASNISNAVTRKCERLLFRFNEPTETERFDTALLTCRLQRSERTKERNLELLRLANGFGPSGAQSPTSPRSILSTPSMSQSRTFATFPAPVMSSALQNSNGAPFTAEAREPIMTSAPQDFERAPFISETSAGFPLPRMSPAVRDPNSAQFQLAIPRSSSTPQIETVIPGYRLELPTERPIRQVHGDSMPTQEMPVINYRRWGG